MPSWSDPKTDARLAVLGPWGRDKWPSFGRLMTQPSGQTPKKTIPESAAKQEQKNG